MKIKIKEKDLRAMHMNARFLEFINIVMAPEITLTADRFVLGRELKLAEGFEFAVEIIMDYCIQTKKKLIFIGNGGSAAISSHQALDFFLNLKIDARAFNDGSFLTCMINDFGYENIFAKPILTIARPGDVLAAISSSGKSLNIIKAVEVARAQGCQIITMSGFGKHNPLRKKGNINFYVPSASYRIVEAAHSLYWDFLLEMLIEKCKK